MGGAQGLVSTLPPKFFVASSEVAGAKGEVDVTRYYKSPGCVNSMCDPAELTKVCLNSLGIALLEHQDYDDYKGVVKLYDKLSAEDKDRVVQENLRGLVAYMQAMFANYDKQSGLSEDEKEGLRVFLEVINPFYYQYMLFTKKLPEAVHEVVFAEMRRVRGLKEPLDLIRMFLNYYNTINPYNMSFTADMWEADKMSDYL